MKLRLSSSGCESRPVRGQPTQPVASLAAGAVTRSAMRRHANEWAVGIAATKRRSSWVPKVLCSLKATAVAAPWASSDTHPAGSTTTARSKRTAQQPGRPSLLLVKRPGLRRTGDPSPTRSVSAGCTRCRPQLRHRTSTRDEVGRRQGTTGAEADGDGGVGGLHTSYDVGERDGARTRPSKGGPCWCDLSKGPMTGALTPECHVTETSTGSGTSATGTRRTVPFTCASDGCARAGGRL